MTPLPCDTVQEYEVPSGVTTLRIEAESSGWSGHSSSSVTLQVQPGATIWLRFSCLPARGSSTDTDPRAQPR